MSKIVYVLSELPELAKLTAKALPECQVIDVKLRHREVIDDQELNDLKDAEILLGDPNLLVQTFHKLPKIKWIQTTRAGIDWFVNVLSETNQKPPEFAITRFTGSSFGQSIFDYCIAQIIMFERKFFDNYITTKINKRWQREVRYNSKSTNEITIAILGATGAIGSFVAQKFSLLGSRVIGYGRTEYSNEYIKDTPLDKYSTKLEDILPESDYIISVLPSTTQLKGLLNNGVLQMCKEKRAVLINVGRGSLIEESEIIIALNNNWIAAAILDVFETEPLPENSPLWSHPNVFITPHNSIVSPARDFAKLFAENYHKFVSNQQLPYLIDWKRGY